MNTVFRVFSLIIIAMVALIDSSIHFDKQLVRDKRVVFSAQRHWNLFYHQSYVYHDSAMRLDFEFKEIKELIIPGSVLLSDITTSYYSAAYLPVYVPNVHEHHTRSWLREWAQILDSQDFCYLESPIRKKRVERFISEGRGDIDSIGASFAYILVNKDQESANLRRDCLSQTRTSFIANIGELAQVVYEGEFLLLYKVLRQ